MITIKEIYENMHFGVVGAIQLMILPEQEGQELVYQDCDMKEAVAKFGYYNLIQMFGGHNNKAEAAIIFVVTRPRGKR